MNKKELITFFNDISPNDKKKQKMLTVILNYEGDVKMKQTAKRFSALTVAAVVLLTTLVFAATSGSFQQLLSRLNLTYKDYINPVELSSVDNAIKMEVVAVGVYNNQAMAYITIQDLEGNRVNETTRVVFGSYETRDDEIQIFCVPKSVDYDEETGVHTYMLEEYFDSPIEAKNATISLNGIYSNPKICDGKIDMGLADTNPETVQISYGIAGVSKTETILTSDSMNITFPEADDHRRVTGIGIIDGKLHIQVYRSDTDKITSPTWGKLYNNDGQLIKETNSIYFSTNDKGELITNGDGMCDHIEFIYDIDINNLQNYTFMSNFKVWDEIKGNWNVTAEINSNSDTVEILDEIQVDGLTINKIAVTPLNVTFSVKKHSVDDFDFDGLDVKLHESDKSVQLYSWSISDVGDDGQDEARMFDTLMFKTDLDRPQPINTKSLSAISINGKVISVK